MFTGKASFSAARLTSTEFKLGVVVENFSYVFQLAGSASISREEMRSFKKIWNEFDPTRTGSLPRSKFVAFFSVGLGSPVQSSIC